MIDLSKMLWLLVVLVATASAANSIPDPGALAKIFGTPPPTTQNPLTTVSTTQRLEDITVKPTEGTSTFINKDGDSCKCVPYYLCDKNLVAFDINNPNITGFNKLDVRFGEENEHPCLESVELCCTAPVNPATRPKPTPQPPKQPGCGYRNPYGLGITITGGSGLETEFGEFPWVVAVMHAKTGAYGGVGVLIHPQVVMTGAHIAIKFGDTTKIRAGEWDTQTVKEIYDFQERQVAEIFMHKDFQPGTLKNDIALMRLAEPVSISEHVNVLCMPEHEEVFDSHKNCVANGWGKDIFGQAGRYAVFLKKVEVDMVDRERCNMLLRRTRLGNNFQLHSSFVCAGGEEGKDTCQGDGGAPLACPIGNNRYKLAGLVAGGIGCGQKDVPAMYTNVAGFRKWVDNKMAEWGFQDSLYRISV